MNFIKRFWEGNASMVISFWIFNVLIEQIVIGLLAVIIILSNLPKFLILFMWAPYKIWAVVGFWRSAEKYKGNFIWVALTLIFLSYRIFTLRIILF